MTHDFKKSFNKENNSLALPRSINKFLFSLISTQSWHCPLGKYFLLFHLLYLLASLSSLFVFYLQGKSLGFTMTTLKATTAAAAREVRRVMTRTTPRALMVIKP